MDGKTLADRAGITYRQLDHWTTKGYLRPVGMENPGSGHRREFTHKMQQKAESMKCLLEVGIEPWMASRIAEMVVFQEGKRIHLGHGVTMLIEPHDHRST